MDEPSRTGKVRIWLRRGWHDTALPKRTSRMTAVLPWCRILAEWMSREAHAIEKFCLFFGSAEKQGGAACFPPAERGGSGNSPRIMWRSLHKGWTRARRCWRWQTSWASPAARPWRWATARTTAHCWKKPVSALPWPTLCRPSKHWQTTSARRDCDADGVAESV